MWTFPEGQGQRLGMSSKTEEFFYLMLWGAETLSHPTFHNMTESFESWAYRQGLLRYLDRPEKRECVETKPGRAVERICRLTEAGRLMALGGSDPESRWGRSWDCKWRLVAFDLPEKHNASRVRLRRYLKRRGFGYLQKSLWISPDPLGEDVKKLSALGEDVESLLTLEAKPCSGESDESIVSGAWDFKRINRLHEECLLLLQSPPVRKSGKVHDPGVVQQWALKERRAWQAALKLDPLLPSKLLPPGYLGREVWSLRNAVLRDAGKWL